MGREYGIILKTMILTFEVSKKTGAAYEVAWGCHAQCCIRSETGSKGWYMLS